MLTRVAAVAVCVVAGPATASQTVVFTIGSPSGISLELCQDLPIVGGCDADSSGVVGTGTLLIDEDAGTVVLVGFHIATTETLTYTYTGVLSSITASAPAVDLFYDSPAPTPAAPLVGGAFTLAGVAVNIAGQAAVTGAVFGQPVEEAIDFSDFGPFVADLSGTVTPDGLGGYTLDASFAFDETTTGDFNGTPVTTTATGQLTLAGTGVVVPAGCNPADVDANGVLNVDDIEVFVTAFLSGDLAADLDGSGSLNVDDIEGFVAAFLAGCP